MVPAADSSTVIAGRPSGRRGDPAI